MDELNTIVAIIDDLRGAVDLLNTDSVIKAYNPKVERVLRSVGTQISVLQDRLAGIERIRGSIQKTRLATVATSIIEDDRTAIIRALGVIEGVAFSLDDRYSGPLLDSVEVIDCILSKESTQNENH